MHTYAFIHTYTLASIRAYIPIYTNRCEYQHTYLHMRICRVSLNVTAFYICVSILPMRQHLTYSQHLNYICQHISSASKCVSILPIASKIFEKIMSSQLSTCFEKKYFKTPVRFSERVQYPTLSPFNAWKMETCCR